mgnify:FL=1
MAPRKKLLSKVDVADAVRRLASPVRTWRGSDGFHTARCRHCRRFAVVTNSTAHHCPCAPASPDDPPHVAPQPPSQPPSDDFPAPLHPTATKFFEKEAKRVVIFFAHQLADSPFGPSLDPLAPPPHLHAALAIDVLRRHPSYWKVALPELPPVDLGWVWTTTNADSGKLVKRGELLAALR